jgi:hypothetical protein
MPAGTPINLRTVEGALQLNLGVELGLDTRGFLLALVRPIEAKLATISSQQETLMTALSDAVAAITATLTQLQTDMNKAFTDLEAAVASGNPADVTAAVTALGALNTQLQSMDASAIAADATTTSTSSAPASAAAVKK